MLKFIPTERFLIVMVLVTAAYYLVILALFYRSDIKHLLRDKIVKLHGPPDKAD